VDMAKYRRIFLEEATEHLAEIGTALLALEKETANPDAIDLIFRMAHSIKGMAASLGYDAITEVSHRLEDRMQSIRSAGRVADPEELALLFRGVECLEAMVRAVANEQEPKPDPELVRILAEVPAPVPAQPKKKLLSLTPLLP